MIPDTLGDRRQWICWRTECRDCGERYPPTTKHCEGCVDSNADPVKTTKKPVRTDGEGLASSTDPDTWGDLADAKSHNESADVDGVGFVFDAEGLVAGVDLDDCRDPNTGEIDDWARDVVDRLDSFTEVSPSGTGLHVYILGFVPDGGNRADVGDGEIEIYDNGRYFTVSGRHVDGTPKEVNQAQDSLKETTTPDRTKGRWRWRRRQEPRSSQTNSTWLCRIFATATRSWIGCFLA